MIQAFYTAASGMKAQQRGLDVVSNNLANVNTPGYRIRRVEFQEILNIQLGSDDLGVYAGYGAMVSSISTMSIPHDINPLKMTINGDGFFVLQDEEGNRSYTKNGDFTVKENNGTYYLAAKSGEFVLDAGGNRIEMPRSGDEAIVAGGLLYPNGNDGTEGIKLDVVRFNNLEGLGKKSGDQFVVTEQSEEPVASTDTISSSYFDELSYAVMENQINEITKLQQGQMAYQFNSKVLQVADEIEGMANHLRY